MSFAGRPEVTTMATVFLCASFAGAGAAEIPAKYRGVYAMGETCAELPKSENDIGEFPWLIVTRNNIHAHETLCSVTAVRQNVKKNYDELTLSCVSDGDETPSKHKEVWSLQLETKKIWQFKIAQPYLVHGESRFKRCALQLLPGRD